MQSTVRHDYCVLFASLFVYLGALDKILYIYTNTTCFFFQGCAFSNDLIVHLLRPPDFFSVDLPFRSDLTRLGGRSSEKGEHSDKKMKVLWGILDSSAA